MSQASTDAGDKIRPVTKTRGDRVDGDLARDRPAGVLSAEIDQGCAPFGPVPGGDVAGTCDMPGYTTRHRRPKRSQRAERHARTPIPDHAPAAGITDTS